MSMRALLLLVLAAPVPAQVLFTDFQWTGSGCITLAPIDLKLSTCSSTCAGDVAFTSFVAPKQGTFTLTLKYRVPEQNKFTFFQLVAGGELVFGLSGPGTQSWCEPEPCMVTIPGVSFHVKAGDTVAFLLDAEEGGCVTWEPLFGAGATFVTLSDLQFVPDVGLLPSLGALDGSLQQSVLATPKVGNLGAALVDVGDVNGDGLRDWAAGAPSGAPLTPQFNGSVRVLSGAGGTLLELLGGPDTRSFGQALADAGDLDGDGRHDLWIGSPFNAGLAGVPFVRAVSLPSGATLKQFNGPTGSWLGLSLATADVDGDGVRDLLTGARWDNPAPSLAGTGRLYLLSGANATPLLTVDGSAPGESLGVAVAIAGDLDLDGVPDLLGGAVANDAGGTDAGRFGAWSGATGALLWSVSGSEAHGMLGSALAGLPDVNGDGVPDVAAGAPGWLEAGTPSLDGRVLVCSGANGALLWQLGGAEGSEEQLGSSLARVHDLDGDGLADLLAGAPRAPEGEHPYLEPSMLSTRGRVFALSSVSGAVIQAIGPVADASDLGFAVAAGGDLTGDGVPDLLIGAPGSNVPLQSLTSGSAHVFSGNLADWGAPLLSGDGDLVAGTPVTISITGGPAFAPVLLIAGFAEVPTKLKGGVLSPTPDLLFAGLALDSLGQLDLPGTWPAGVPSATSLWLQAWMPAAAGPKGFYATNGLQLLTP